MEARSISPKRERRPKSKEFDSLVSSCFPTPAPNLIGSLEDLTPGQHMVAKRDGSRCDAWVTHLPKTEGVLEHCVVCDGNKETGPFLFNSNAYHKCKKKDLRGLTAEEEFMAALYMDGQTREALEVIKSSPCGLSREKILGLQRSPTPHSLLSSPPMPPQSPPPAPPNLTNQPPPEFSERPAGGPGYCDVRPHPNSHHVAEVDANQTEVEQSHDSPHPYEADAEAEAVKGVDTDIDAQMQDTDGVPRDDRTDAASEGEESDGMAIDGDPATTSASAESWTCNSCTEPEPEREPEYEAMPEGREEVCASNDHPNGNASESAEGAEAFVADYSMEGDGGDVCDESGDASDLESMVVGGLQAEQGDMRWWICRECGSRNQSDWFVCVKCLTGNETPQQWTCKACTFLNYHLFTQCEQCETPKPIPEGWWACKNCTLHSPHNAEHCLNCNQTKPAIIGRGKRKGPPGRLVRELEIPPNTSIGRNDPLGRANSDKCKRAMFELSDHTTSGRADVAPNRAYALTGLRGSRSRSAASPSLMPSLSTDAASSSSSSSGSSSSSLSLTSSHTSSVSSSTSMSRSSSLPALRTRHFDDRCMLCSASTSEDPDHVILCDGCDNEAHLACLGLHCVPPGDWFCESCRIKPTQRKKGKGRSLSFRGIKRKRRSTELLQTTTVTMKLAVGKRVWAKWPKDNQFYRGEIKRQLEGHKFVIQFDDGDVMPNDKEGIPPASMEDILQLCLTSVPSVIENLKFGDRVSAVYDGERSDAVVVRTIVNTNTDFVSGHLVFFTLDDDTPDESIGMSGLVRPSKDVKRNLKNLSCWKPPGSWEDDYLDQLVATYEEKVLESDETCVMSHYPRTSEEAIELREVEKRRQKQQPHKLLANLHEYFAGSCSLTSIFLESQYGEQVCWQATTFDAHRPPLKMPPNHIGVVCDIMDLPPTKEVVHHCHASPECTTFTRLSQNTSRGGHQRTREDPLGQTSESYKANYLHYHTTQIIRGHLTKNPYMTYTVENPDVNGGINCFDLECWITFLEKTKGKQVKISYCKFGEPFQKNTLIATNSRRLISELEKPQYRCCGKYACNGHKTGVRDQKRSPGGKGAQIPRKLALLIADVVSQDFVDSIGRRR